MTEQVSPLRSFRISKGWKLTKAAGHFGISVSHLSELETGKSKPSVEVAAKLAKKTKIPVMVLLGLEATS